MSTIFDVIVIGAGPAGSAASFFLSKAGLNVLMVDKASFPRDKTCGDALSNRAIKIIDLMGGLNKLQKMGKSISKLRFFPPSGNSLQIPIPQINQYKTLIVPRFLLDDYLKELSINVGTTFIGDYKINAVKHENQTVFVSGKKGTYEAKLVIYATGANTTLLRKLSASKHPLKFMHATRVYFEGVENLDEVIFNYDFSALPSYGWIFPLPNGMANVGAGFYRTKLNQHKLPSNSAQSLRDYLALPAVKKILRKAKMVGEFKGHPLKVDYLSAPKYMEDGFVIGEAAGLVNPITGEGIDYALESGEFVAKHVFSMFKTGNFSKEKFKEYQQKLDKKYRSNFIQYEWIRDSIFNNVFVLNKVLRKASKNKNFAEKLLNVSLGNIPPYKLLF
jgi:menaquinone-9 beta-reductase